MASVVIRKALKDDFGEILRLIKEMAHYIRLENQLNNTAKKLQEDFASGFFESFVGEDSNRPGHLVAYCIYYYTYSTFNGRTVYLEDIYVSGCCRNQGVGKRLLKALSQTALENHCTRMDFVVLNWNAPSIQFYKRFGAENVTATEQWNLYRFDKSKMSSLARK